MAGGGKSRKTVAAKQTAATQAVSSEVCAVCQEAISDSTQSCEGQGSVFCEGPCQKWINGACAGLLISAFTAIVKSKNPFHCLQCSLSIHASEIEDLRSQVSQLSKELVEMKSRLVDSQPEDSHPSTSSAANLSPSNTATHVPITNAAKLKEPFDIKERERKLMLLYLAYLNVQMVCLEKLGSLKMKMHL